MRRHKRVKQWRPGRWTFTGAPPWVRLTPGPTRWTVRRAGMSRRWGHRPLTVCYAVELVSIERLTCCRDRRAMLADDPAFYVYGHGRAGCRSAKRVARRLAHDPAAVATLPAGRVLPMCGRRPPGASWWVWHHPARPAADLAA